MNVCVHTHTFLGRCVYYTKVYILVLQIQKDIINK